MKIIALTQGLSTMVDDEDYEYLMTFYKWYAVMHHGTYYAKSNSGAVDGKRTTIKMHRIIIGACIGEIIDHINGNGLDNRKENLRIVTSQYNAFNRKSHSHSSSAYKGVAFHKQNEKWQVNICKDGKNIYLGTFRTEEDAAKEYDKHAVEYFGEFARLNFPGSSSMNQTSAITQTRRTKKCSST